MRIFWSLRKGCIWGIMNISSASSNTPRKRCLSASSSLNKLGELDGCSKRSPRFKKASKSLEKMDMINSSNLAENSRPPSGSRQKHMSTLATNSQASKTYRKWQNTTLGIKYESKEYKLHRDDSIITLMSYNVLADHLAAMHPELYTHCKKQGWCYLFNTLVFMK